MNAAEAGKGRNLSTKDAPGPLPTARSLDEIRAAERARGLEIVEPSLASE